MSSFGGHVCTAQTLADFSIESGDKNSAEASYTLLYKTKAVGKLESIGGKPSLKSLEQLTSPKGTKFFSLTYHAGSAGTSVVSYVDHMAVLDMTANPKVLLDILVELHRDSGIGKQSTYKRSLVWTNHGSTLVAGPIDDQPKILFQWSNNAFKATPQASSEKIED